MITALRQAQDEPPKGSFFMKVSNFKKGVAVVSVVFFILAVVAFKSFAQTIDTEDATSGTVIQNIVNTNIIRCCTPTPTQKPEEPTPTPTTGEPTPTPTTPPSNGGGDGGGGQGGPAGEAAPAQAVLGLAATSGENELFNLIKILPAFGSLAVGYGLLRKNA